MFKDENEKNSLDSIKRQSCQAKILNQLLENTLLGPELSNCSCAECDSLRCFTIRRDQANSICACNDCKRSNTCVLYANDNNPESKPILKTPKSYENYKAKNILKSVDFCEKTSYHKTIKYKNGHVDRIIQSKFNCKAPSRDVKHLAETSKRREKSYTKIHTAVLRYPCKNISKTTAQLSAQIMNVPLQDFNQSLSTKKPCEELSSKIDDVKQDIFSRLKEIYKACSCKVCECIPVSPSFFTRTDMCSCKSCNCNECKHLYRHVSDIKETPHEGCPCIRCDRKDCRGIAKTTSNVISCNCKPCDCIKCSESFSKPCNCEPCKCLECRSMPSRLPRTITVAAVEEHILRNLCDCSPCECSRCTHNYNTTSNLRERSTGTVTHSLCPCDNCTNDSCQSDGANCRCEMHKGIMNKPIQRDHHDYDIRSLRVTDNWPRLIEDKVVNKADIITMHAKIPQDGFGVRIKECECGDCQCAECVELNMRSKSHFSRPDLPHCSFNLPAPIKNLCKCESCECNICYTHLGENGSVILKETKCKCDICDCLSCGNLDCSRSKARIYNTPIRQEFVANYVPNPCECNSCECVDCMKNNHCVDNQNQPTREYANEEKTLRQSPYETSVKKSQMPSKLFVKAMIKDQNTKPSRSSNKIKSKQNVSIYRALSQHNYYDSQKSMTILDSSIDDSSMYFSAPDSNDELLTPEELLSLGQCKKFDDFTSLVINHGYIYSGKPKTICIQNNLSQSKLSSLHLHGQTTQPTLDFSEHLDINPHYRFSNKSNYIEKTPIEYSNSLCNKNISYHKNISNSPIYFKTLCNRNIAAFDYDKVLGTLQDAQDFSVKLNEILETYEMANNNFVSISQRLRGLYETFVSANDNSYIHSNNDKTKYIGDSKYPTLDQNSANIKDSSTTSESSTENETKLKPIFGSHNLLENIDCNEFQKRICKPERYEDFGDVTKSGKLSHSKNNNNRINKRHKLCQGFCKHSKIILKDLKSNNKILSQKQIANNFTEIISSSAISKKSLSMSTDRKEKQEQEICLNTDVTCLFQDANFYKDAGTDSDTNYFFKVNDEACKKEDLALQLILQSNQTNKKNESVDSDKTHNILSKNLYINTDRKTQNKCICTIPLLEVNVKEVLDIISREIRHDREKLVTSKRRHIKTLEEKSYSNIRRFLNGLVSRAILRSELRTTRRISFDHQRNKPSAKMSRSCSKNETLKASFYNLRRISDHTVLVKWNIPHDITEVQGYELQVDGRAVQKIFSPTRSIAVVTCLPHSEKVLLSIRTLTTDVTCNPTTTTVYHPRNK